MRFEEHETPWGLRWISAPRALRCYPNNSLLEQRSGPRSGRVMAEARAGNIFGSASAFPRPRRIILQHLQVSDLAQGNGIADYESEGPGAVDAAAKCGAVGEFGTGGSYSVKRKTSGRLVLNDEH